MPYRLDAQCERLVGIRIITPIASEDVRSFGVALNTTVSQIVGGSIICVDVRQAELFPPHVMTQHQGLMRQLNGHFLRSVFWVAGDGLHTRQIERMVRESHNPLRRVMRQPLEIELWLGEITTPKERRALHGFVFGHVANEVAK